MARQRKPVKDRDVVGIKSPSSVKHKGKSARPVGMTSSIMTILISILVLLISYASYSHYLQTRVTTPLGVPSVITSETNASVASKLWGSYHSGVYFGMKARTPHSLSTGMMWLVQEVVNNDLPLRHQCNRHDGLRSYGWLEHDGVNFGVQDIIDDKLQILTAFAKRVGRPGEWTARINVNLKNSSDPVSAPVSLFFYVATDNYGTITPQLYKGNILTSVEGETDELGKFSLTFIPNQSRKTLQFNFLSTVIPSGLQRIKETIMQNLVLFRYPKDKIKFLGLVGTEEEVRKADINPNFIVYQATFEPPFELEVAYEIRPSDSQFPPLIGEEFEKVLAQHRANFHEKFEDTFKLTSKGYDLKEISIAKAILSDVLGGIGYFYGSSLVQSEYNPEPVPYWEASLYTAVPSCSFFPRGFLWDEGFHNLLISQWDIEITKDILAHWLNLINIEGWIPREQILGKEAQARVPEEFIVQRNTNANPPALFLTFETLMHIMNQPGHEKDLQFLSSAFPRLQAWYNWFNTTQLGSKPGSYRWRGRDATTEKELNPKTLSSGLDDYPRATHPTDEEIHVDLLCWMAYASKIMSRIAEEINENWMDYARTYRTLSNNKHIDNLHWSENSQSYCDYGLHSDNVKLVKRQVSPSGHSHPHQPPSYEYVRQVMTKPYVHFVEEFGYVNLFPFLLQIIEPDNPKLEKVLTDLKNPNLLWTKFGLRSLAKTSRYYMKHNTEHDPPYWRGPIWINLNYLALRSLRYYSRTPGPYQEVAFDLYKALRKNLVDNILKEYQITGYLWEQYNDKTGVGQGIHPFTGWSSLVLLMMAEIY